MNRTLSSHAYATLIAAITEREVEVRMAARRLYHGKSYDEAKLFYNVADELLCLQTGMVQMIPSHGVSLARYFLSLELSASSDTTPEPSLSSSS